MPREVEGDWRAAHDRVSTPSISNRAPPASLSVDLLTTLYAAALYGPAAEANPYVRHALDHGVPRLVAMNLAVLAVAVALVAAYMRVLSRTRGVEAWVMARSFELWAGGLIAVGLFVFANNLSVIVLGGSLV
ncbi:hypothetical protein BRC63_01665 [Halobacteriales archaeon QH_10_70_21]|nr:MAG: hypothetical protein BRC63_01665 [Halobacteriales archaeon QH_10_70_21]